MKISFVASIMPACLALFCVVGCGKQEKKKDPGQTPNTPGTLAIDPLEEIGDVTSPGVVAATCNSGASASIQKIAVGGQLALGTGLTGVTMPDKILAIPISGQSMLGSWGASGLFDQIQTIPVDPSTHIFKAALFKNEFGEAAKTFMDCIAGSTVDRACINAKASAQDAQWYAGQTDHEIITFLTKSAKSWIFVGMNNGANKIAEADSFRYIGLPATNSNLIDYPLSIAKGHLRLGPVSLSSTDDASSALKASDQAFDLSNAALSELASTNAVLKAIKNIYMNATKDSSAYVSANLRFEWNAGLGDSLKSAYSTPDSLTHQGYTIDMGIEKMPNISEDALCKAGQTGHKAFKIVPPGPITFGTTTFDATHPFHNDDAGDISSMECGGTQCQVCHSSNMNFSHYQNAPGDFHLELRGGNGSVKGASPKGLWKAYYDGAEIANIDLASALPIGVDSHPLVYIPAIKVVVDASDKVTDIFLKFYMWNRQTNKFDEVQDLDAFERAVNEPSFSVGGNATLDGNSTPHWINDDCNKFEPVSGTNTYHIPAKNSGMYPGWTFSSTSPSTNRIESIIIWYGLYGNSMMFNFNRMSK